MQCMYPGCSDAAQPESDSPFPYCSAHSPEFVAFVGLLFPPHHFLPLEQVSLGPPRFQPEGDPPPASAHDEELFGSGHDQPPGAPPSPREDHSNGQPA